jgi:hypothetical protein
MAGSETTRHLPPSSISLLPINRPSVIWIVPCVALPGDMARTSPSTSWNLRPVPSPGQPRNSATVIAGEGLRRALGI